MMKIIEIDNPNPNAAKNINTTIKSNSLFIPTRCPICNQRFFDIALNSTVVIQIKCPKCGRIFKVIIDEIGNDAA